MIITETAEGEPLGIGRKSRIVPKALARAVRARDGNRCRFPGCDNRRFLIHHIEHLGERRKTCRQPAAPVHPPSRAGARRRFPDRQDFLDRWTFFRPDGIVVP
ncbi:MAG: hypothetical protein U5K76_01490 [Woeseiaceae bacterium]|nr:hypothetical protein [Woeseiaceae bacterium]